MSIMSNAKRALAIAAAAATLLSMAACGSSNAASGKSDSSGAASSGKIEVVASINQWGSVAEDLGGSNVEVTNIMTKTNVEAHDYEPTSQDVAKFGTAKVAVVNGADYDPWATKAAQPTKATLVTAAETAGIKEGDNPHVWFSAAVRKAVAQAITRAYEGTRPDGKADFDKLNQQWRSKEDEVARKITETKRKADGEAYAATESVAEYLAGDLGLKDATPTGYMRATANESEPTPTDIKQFNDMLEAGKVGLLVVNIQEETELTGKIVTAAKSSNIPIVELTEQMPEQYDSLTDWMAALVDAFSKAI